MYHTYFLLLYLLLSSHKIINPSANMLFIIPHEEKYEINNLIEISKSVGFQATALPFYSITKKDLSHAQAITFLIDDSILEHTDHSLITQLLENLYLYAQDRSHLFTLILPHSTSQSALNKVFRQTPTSIAWLLKQRPELTLEIIEIIFTKRHLTYPSYNTSLLPRCTTNIHPLYDQSDQSGRNQSISYLPNFCASKELANIFPLGLYFEPTLHSGHISLLSSRILANEMVENFLINPCCQLLRSEIKAAQKNIFEFFASCLNILEHTNQSIEAKEHINKKQNHTYLKHHQRPYYAWITQEGIRCGWLDLEAYDDKMRISGIETIIESNINLLWLRVNPELYFSKQAIKINDREHFIENLKAFCDELYRLCSQHHHPVPKLFIGTEITSNLKHALLPHAAVDQWGKIYSQIPSPLDRENFWYQELINPIQTLISIWPDKVSKNILPTGVFLDFEMYHAQSQASSFTYEMDFSNLAFEKFAHTSHLPKTSIEVPLADRFAYLIKNNLLAHYYEFLGAEMQSIGQNIKKELSLALPNGIIAVYNMTLPHSRFYRGLLAGLSSKQEPLILATFNLDCYSHYSWLIKNNIFLYHIPVIMLSKFSASIEDNCKYLYSANKNHDGFWINRFSRIHHPYNENPRIWYNLEQTKYTQATITAMKNH